jgi:TonB-linked SusC/RagA family outer membrane protein
MHLNAFFKAQGRFCSRVHKIALVMQLTSILLLGLSLQVSAVSYAQKVTIWERDASLKKIFREIRKQTGYYFIYTNEAIQRASPVTLHVKDANIQDVLNLCFSNQPLSYTIDDQIIIVKPRPLLGPRPQPPLLPDLSVPPQTQIHGIVSDSATGKPLAGVTIQVKGTSSGTVTDGAGRFVLVVPDDATLEVSYLGYNSKDLPVGNRTIINISLSSTATGLNQLVVVGYGTQKKSTLTGSVSQVAGSEVAKSPAANVTSSLQGRLPGLIANQRNGQPGRDDPDILIRGTGTVPPPGGDFNALLSANAPLVVIDGVPRDGLSRLNPEDIESISVLKDASAAIYGARAANGVILVTTKSGTRGKAEFTITTKYAMAHPTKVPDVLDAATFAEVYNEGVFYRANRDPNNYTPQYSDEAIQKYRDGSDPVLYPNTDWVGLVLKPHSTQANIDLQVNGGSDKVRYLLSFGSLYQDGSFKAEPSTYHQYNMRAKVDVDLVKNFTVGANIYATLSNGTYSPVSENTNFVNILQANPTLVGVYPNGLLGGGRLGQSPLLMDQRGYDKIENDPIYSTFTASYTVPFVKGLKLDGSFNYDLRNQFEKSWETPYYFYEYNTNTENYDKKQVPPLNASLTDTYSRWTTMLYNLRVSYEKTIQNNHHIALMLGWEQQKTTWSFANASRKNYLSSAIDQINQGSNSAADLGNAGSAADGAYNNYFGRLNYNYKSKYLLEFLFRNDGSQIFPAGKRYGFFPGVSVGWRLSEEEFFKEAFPFVDQLKLRASYGEVGNDRIDTYQYLQSFFFGNNYVFGTNDAPGIYAGVLANPNITWERAKKTDIGLESQLWNGKLGIDFTYWMQKRDNILIKRNLSVPAILGFPGLPYENLGKVDSHGFELVLNHSSKIGQLVYNLSANIAYQTSDVKFLDEVPPAEDYQKITGKPVFTDLYYKADGIFHNQEELDKYPHSPNSQIGDIRVIDLNGDGEINDKDRYRESRNAIPKYVFGLNSNFSYKNFDLTIFFQGQTGAYNYDGTVGALGGTDFANSSVWRATDRWSETNPTGSKPRSDAWQPGNTTFFLFDATFVRLKTVELGYSLPTAILERTHFLKEVRVFASAFNLATWSKDVKWADPEFNGGYLTYPPQRIINFGATVKF